MSNLKEVVEYVAANNGLSKKATEGVLKSAFAFIKDELAQGNEVVIDKFGKFSAKVRDARKGRNPITGATIDIPAKTAVTFKAAKSLKDEVNS